MQHAFKDECSLIVSGMGRLLALELGCALLAGLLVQLAVDLLAVHAAVLDEAAVGAGLELDGVAPLLATVGARCVAITHNGHAAHLQSIFCLVDLFLVGCFFTRGQVRGGEDNSWGGKARKDGRGGEDTGWGKARKDGTVPSTPQHNLLAQAAPRGPWRFEKRARPVIIMGKKACLALDTNDYSDDYADIDETWFDHHDHDEEERLPSPIESARLGRSRTRQNDSCVVATNERSTVTARLARTFSDRQPKRTVITPRLGKTAYIGNPLRRPVFTEKLASNDALLVQTLSFLDLLDVVTLSKVSTGLREQIDSFEGLFCRIESSLSSDGNLLPCLLPIKGRLLTLSTELPRPA
ncbi:hypothetical protein THAOC_14653, partial [Thalassiosira oceanica]